MSGTTVATDHPPLARPADARPSDGPYLPALLSGLSTALIGAAGVTLGLVGLFGHVGSVHLGWLLPLSGVLITIDPLGGLFLVITGAVGVAVGSYTIGYARREHLPRFSLAVLPLFVFTMLLVPAAGSVSTLLFGWELMALTSLVLVLTEHHRPEARAAGVFYAVLTQLGFVALLVGLLVLSAAGGADSFAALAARIPHLAPATRNVVFVFTLIGFGSKAGLLPLHAWLPRAHPEAPSPVSALMSAAMVSMGIYGLIRIDLQLLGPGPRWWGLVLLILGGSSALFGVLHASVASDLKQLLAYSTIENMGLITICLGAADLLAAAHATGIGATRVASIALTAALLQVIAHAAFKTLAFLAAGSVLAGTGLRDLDRLGGLARRMPLTTGMFGLAALGACGLPLGAGFVSEWMLLQALLHAPRTGDTLLALAMPLAVGVVALTTGLAVAAMVKAFGVGFLARARSPEASRAREASPGMVAGMSVAALACVVVAVAPIVLRAPLDRVLSELAAGPHPELGATLRLPGVAGSIAPGWLALGLAGAVLVALVLGRWGARRRPPPVTAPLWACGAAGLTPRMEYTATSFAEPLQRVFDDVLRPDTDIQVSHHAESQYLLEKISYRVRVGDAIERYLYEPVVRTVHAVSRRVRGAHNGSVHTYLLYGAAGLLVVIVAALAAR